MRFASTDSSWSRLREVALAAPEPPLAACGAQCGTDGRGAVMQAGAREAIDATLNHLASAKTTIAPPPSAMNTEATESKRGKAISPMNHDQTFRACTDCCLSFGPSIRHLPQAQVTSDARETRSMAGGPVHSGDVTACGHGFLAGADRLDGRSRLDGRVLSITSSLAEVDRSR